MPAQSGINLLPRDELAKGYVTKVLNWALTFGRYIVIATELVVIVAFLMRFSLDQRLADLYDSIKEKQLFVEANRDFENNFREIQRDLTIANQASSQQLGVVSVIAEFAQLVPGELRFTSLSLEEKGFRISGVANSESSLAVFIRNLSNNKNLRNVSVGAVSSLAEAPGYQFSVTGLWLKNEQINNL